MDLFLALLFILVILIGYFSACYISYNYGYKRGYKRGIKDEYKRLNQNAINKFNKDNYVR